MSSIPRATHLYAIRAGRTGFVKIGITGDPVRRLKQMQTDCPYKVRYIGCVECPRAYDAEQWIHKQIQRRHIRGEWFWIWRDARIHALVREAIRLRDCDELPEAAPFWERLHPWTLKKQTTRPSAISPKPPRLALDKTRAAVLEELLTHGWTITDLRRENILRGDNATISQEVAETRKRLGLADPDRTIKVRDEKGERVIPA